MPTLIRHRVWAQSVTGKTILLLPGAVHTVFQSAVQPTLICLAEHKSTKPNCFQPLQSVLKNISQDVPHHLKSLRLTTLALCGTLTAVCTTLLHSVFHWSLICVLWPTHFSAHQYVFNLQVLKGDSNCKQPKRYLSLTSKHNGVSFFQHGLHWGVNEKKMAFQDSTYWARPRTVQQLWEMNTQKCLFPTQSDLLLLFFEQQHSSHCNSFCNIPWDLHPWRGIPHWWEEAEMPALPTTQGCCQELLLNRAPPWAFQAALSPTAALSWLCCTNCLLFSWQMGNYLSHFTKAKK